MNRQWQQQAGYVSHIQHRRIIRGLLYQGGKIVYVHAPVIHYWNEPWGYRGPADCYKVYSCDVKSDQETASFTKRVKRIGTGFQDCQLMME